MFHDLLIQFSQLLALLYIPIAVLASMHVVLHKEDERAAIGWVGLIWLSPIVGSILYWFFGINRIQRRAVQLRAHEPDLHLEQTRQRDTDAALSTTLGEQTGRYRPLVRLVGNLTDRALLAGNAVSAYTSGDDAYPAMLEAIEGAEHSVAMSSYIFDNDRAGGMFRDALSRAVKRGVAVRVLIDDIGSRYTWPPILRSLRKAGIRAARFLPTFTPFVPSYTNLRNHRKLLVVDGQVGFTGGMNIRAGNLLRDQPKHPIHDMHFRLEGPVVAHLMEAFAQDWAFTTKESLEGPLWEPRIEHVGRTLARGISDGPDEDYDKLRGTLLGALGAAHHRVTILTPYFLPGDALISALGLAAQRGVGVRILVPERNNLRLVQWASTAVLPRVLAGGCEVWLTPPPFDHSKLMLVDDEWLLLGSANWDARSLRLNFEFNVECYDPKLVGELSAVVDERVAGARRLEAGEITGRALPYRLRDGIARLASPYL